jgi:hypothetical protein
VTRARAFVPALGLLLAGPLAAQETFALVVTGLSGEARYAEEFHDWALKLRSAAEKRHGLPRRRLTYLAERPERDPGQIDGRSTREGVEAALSAIARQARPGDLVFVLLVGHGSHQGTESRFNLPGPDLTAADFARLIAPFAAQRVVFVNASSASGEFVKALAGPGRVVVTATKSGTERNESVFGGHFVEALSGDVADQDKDGRVSVLEAFDYARREVARAYEKGNRLLTEHALLDDDGDGVGSAEPGPERADGGLARRTFLAPNGSAEATAEGAAADPALLVLRREQREIEERIEALKARKAALPADEYEARLGELFLELALKSEAVRSAARGVK